MRVRSVFYTLFLLVLLSCGSNPGKKTATAPVARPFPATDIPVMLEQPQERISFLTQHFWDRFTAPDSLYFSDSLHINGVLADEVEKQMGLFATLLQKNALPEDGVRAMEQMTARMVSFQEKFPSANLFKKLSKLTVKYFYDPNSPLRNEELYLPFARKMADCNLLTTTEQQRYGWEAQKCALNRPGTPAADFRFIDSFGHKSTLYSIKAQLTLLIFGNPDCHACKELQAALESSEALSSAIESGQLKVVDIYIDEDIDAWKKQIPQYPANWINGYDPDFTIRTDLLYNVRALPSLYLLDKDKKVILKDCTPERLFETLGV